MEYGFLLQCFSPQSRTSSATSVCSVTGEIKDGRYMAISQVTTEILNIGYQDGGPPDGRVVILLHGWPDDVRARRSVAPRLHAAGLRTITPYLRGFGPTRFLFSETRRDARAVGLAQDAIVGKAKAMPTMPVIRSGNRAASV